MALKLWSDLSERMAMRLNSLSTDRASAAKCYSDICASHKTRGAVGGLSEGCNLSSPIPVLVTGMRAAPRRGAGSALSAQGPGLAGSQ